MKKQLDNRKLELSGEEESVAKYNSDKDFTTLEAWKKSRSVKLFFYEEVIPRLPIEEKFNLNVQIRKAAISITANISEGYGRYHYQEGIQFYRISRGSLYELKDHLISCFDMNFVNKEVLDKGKSLIEDTKITLNGYINFVRARKEGK
ncbi:MAG: four helix bundle protein [Bacteroidetes bacterium HGW-Bacteroidetes-21]|jgi:four helix bundle protein|nr:MAG: four helix bundle protein [Bacteroidetes bacterium HGW-Bacteroidetes-21]